MKNADPKRTTPGKSPFDITGIFAGLCARHGFVKAAVNIVKSGERYSLYTRVL